MSNFRKRITRVNQRQFDSKVKALTEGGCVITETTIFTKKRQRLGEARFAALAVIKYLEPTSRKH